MGDHADPSDVLILRLANIVIGAAGIAFAMLSMMWRIRSLSAFVAASAFVALVPMASVVSASVGNDAAAFAAGSIALAAALRLLERGPGPVGGILAGSAFALAALTKLNAGLLVGVFLLVVHGVALHRRHAPTAAWVSHIATASLLCLVGILPYVGNLLRLGSVLYVDLEFHAAQISGPNPWSFEHYATWFVRALALTWSAYEPADALEVAALLALLGLALWGTVWPRSDSNAWIARAGFIALAVVLPIHLLFAYRLHVETLHLSAAQSRYYLPLVAILVFGAAVGIDNLPKRTWRRVVGALCVALSLYGSLIPAALRTLAGWRS